MNWKLTTTFFLTGILTSVSIASSMLKTEAQTSVQFICGASFDQKESERLPTTFAWTTRGKIAVVRWVKALGSRSPQQRCQQVSPRFQQAYNNGSLKFLTNSTASNGQDIICATSKYDGSCETMLMTLRREDKPLQILNELKDTLNGRSVGPVKHSSGTPQVYYQIDMDEWLRNQPVVSKQ